MPQPVVERRPVAGTVAVLAAVSVWGGVAVIARFVDDVDGLALGFHRLWIGSVITLAVFYATGRRLSRAALRLAVPGGLAFGADIVLFFSALKHTTIANATVVGALQPALVLLVAGRMFGEAVTARIIALSAVAIGGVAVVVYGSSGTPVWSIKGDLLAVAALFRVDMVLRGIQRVRAVLTPFEYLTAMLLVATLAVTPVAVLAGPRLDPGGLVDWAWIAGLAIGSGGFGHLLLNWAHGHLDLSVMSLLTLAVPVVAVVSAAVFLDEPIGWVQVLGMAVVVVALGVVALQTTKAAPVAEPTVVPATP